MGNSLLVFSLLSVMCFTPCHSHELTETNPELMGITLTQISGRLNWVCYSDFSPDPAEYWSVFSSWRFRSMDGGDFCWPCERPGFEKTLEKDLSPGQTVFLLILSHLISWCKQQHCTKARPHQPAGFLTRAPSVLPLSAAQKLTTSAAYLSQCTCEPYIFPAAKVEI